MRQVGHPGKLKPQESLPRLPCENIGTRRRQEIDDRQGLSLRFCKPRYQIGFLGAYVNT